MASGVETIERGVKKAEVELFRCGCRHCDQAEADLRRLAEKYGARLEVVQADKQPSPGVRPGWNTPLVYVNGRHVSHYRVSPGEWEKAIAEGVAVDPPTLHGEVLDLDCWLEHVHKGPAHDFCADACLKRGAPLGLLVSNEEVYLLMPDHAAPAAYEALKTRVGDHMLVSGRVHRHGGVQGMVVQKIDEEDESPMRRS